jgi:catechol 2,3-dioxygenase-like lactoylglutathione lyase family enzyme
MLQTLRTVIFHVPDLAAAVAWYTRATGVAPYFHEPFYAGFDLGGTELGLDPDPEAGRAGGTGGTPYWRVRNVDEAHAHLLAIGGRPSAAIRDVGGGIRVAVVADPFGNAVGIIEIPGEGGAPAAGDSHEGSNGGSNGGST